LELQTLSYVEGQTSLQVTVFEFMVNALFSLSFCPLLLRAGVHALENEPKAL
jgi:hypothetical protein